MNDVEIQFNADDLLQAVDDIRTHVKTERKLTLRTTHVALPEAPAELTSAEILATRRALNLSQPLFARLLNVDPGTVMSWEKDRRRPSGAALRLLHIVREHPETILPSLAPNRH